MKIYGQINSEAGDRIELNGDSFTGLSDGKPVPIHQLSNVHRIDGGYWHVSNDTADSTESELVIIANNLEITIPKHTAIHIRAHKTADQKESKELQVGDSVPVWKIHPDNRIECKGLDVVEHLTKRFIDMQDYGRFYRNSGNKYGSLFDVAFLSLRKPPAVR